MSEPKADGMIFDCNFEHELDFVDINYIHLNKVVRYENKSKGTTNTKDENDLLLMMAKGISKMCKETSCDKCLFYLQRQTEFTHFCYSSCCFDKFPAEWFDDEEE